MIRKIVTGVDGNEPATDAARKAAQLAGTTGAELHVVSAYPKFETERIQAGSDEFVYSTEKDALGVANKTAITLQGEFPSLTIQCRAGEGKPADVLVRVADELHADLIVVGNKRVQGLTRALGSIAREVAQRAHCDVYVAHTHPRH